MQKTRCYLNQILKVKKMLKSRMMRGRKRRKKSKEEEKVER